MKKQKEQARRKPSMVRLLAGFLLLSLLGVGCAAAPARIVKVGAADREKTVEMTADNFKFDPAVIQASPGDVLKIRIENLSGTDHNFTLADPQGKILHDIDLPEKSTREITVELAAPGNYPFHCDKPLHPTMGMKGRIEVQ